MQNYNVIGDIHGRTCWKQLVREYSVNIFVGDYFDPYDAISFENLTQNFRDIIAYKEAHPQTVLLYGNHDLHYMDRSDRGSRFDARHAKQYEQLFSDTSHLFNGAAYAAEDFLISHAGVTKKWYENKFGEYKGEEPAAVANEINELWQHNKAEFSFCANATDALDIYGESPTHSPMWIRPWSLVEHNLFAGTEFKQAFGHTQVADITCIDGGLVCVDCLGTTPNSLLLQ